MARLPNLRRHLTFANVAAAMALVVALSGTAYAAATITGADVVNGSLTGADLKDGSVKGIDIGNGTIQAADLADNSVISRSIVDGTIRVRDLSVAAQGALRGPQGADGVSGYEVVDASSDLDSTFDKVARAYCPDSKVVVGGGYYIEMSVEDDILVYANQPGEDGELWSSWLVQAAENTATDNPWRITAYAICVAVPTG